MSVITNTDLAQRYVRMTGILWRLVYDIDRLEDDEFYADYDLAVESAKKLLAECGIDVALTPPSDDGPTTCR